ncbi:MAG: hypothetical protein AB3N13_14495 [Arenibacterium sp.]
MKSPIILVTLAGLALGAPALATETPRNDTDIEANSTAPIPGVTGNPRLSNWPALPERHAGRSYSAIVRTTFGSRERNFESGRR